jgi:serine/threonine protein kinase
VIQSSGTNLVVLFERRRIFLVLVLRMKKSSISAPEGIGPYLFEEKIGEGAFSVVYRATHRGTGLMVAVKILAIRALKSDKKGMYHFESEIRILNEMRHPNIVQLIDLFRDEENMYIVLEYCGGGELFDLIVASNFLSECDAKILFCQLISAVDYLHEARIVHRDLKPENLLMDESGNIKISDFGFSRHMPETSLLATACGSTAYASPECLNGVEYCGMKSDMWSTGIILFAMVTGKLPWASKNIAVVIKQIKSVELEIPSYLSPPLRNLLGSLIRLNPDERLTAKEVLNCEWLKGVERLKCESGHFMKRSAKFFDVFFGRELSTAEFGEGIRRVASVPEEDWEKISGYVMMHRWEAGKEPTLLIGPGSRTVSAQEILRREMFAMGHLPLLEATKHALSSSKGFRIPPRRMSNVSAAKMIVRGNAGGRAPVPIPVTGSLRARFKLHSV